MSYTFPFDTCEVPSLGSVAQPTSAMINGISTLVLVGASMYATLPAVRTTLGTYALFEAWHTWSHMIHISGPSQKRVVHVLGLLMAFATLWMIQSLTNAPMDAMFTGVLFSLLLVDFAITLSSKMDIVGIATGLSIFVWIVCGRWKYLPLYVQQSLIYIVPAVGFLLLLFVNEAVNCKKMQGIYVFPYHAAIEVVGLVLFTWLAYLWLLWESRIRV